MKGFVETRSPGNFLRFIFVVEKDLDEKNFDETIFDEQIFDENFLVGKFSGARSAWLMIREPNKEKRGRLFVCGEDDFLSRVR